MTKQLTVWKTLIAQTKFKEIYIYTRKKWGVKQARAYLAMLDQTIQDVAKGIKPTKINPEYSTRFSYCSARRHYIFFEYQKDKLVVATVFHSAQEVKERMAEEIRFIRREICKF